MADHGRLRRKREHHPGEWAIVVQDCRGAGEATGAEATYEGRFDPTTGRRFRKSGAQKLENILLAVPRLRLDYGSVIWGFECWWRRWDRRLDAKSSKRRARTADEFDEIINEIEQRFPDDMGIVPPC